ncbi:choline/carnitine O-acyltransferase [Cumulibacter manganitolerans]|uniref:choline/carnitine O-acyltransferase n=1 Tax=Cumulibacter manganitolerans TaxID=1884992 RepID=UPI001294C456|nr:choline/carnitine O-acyltransferase [Cumulibacter manganitolerans]
MTGLGEREAALPRAPLPRLERSCRLFLDWCAPLLSPDELARTRDAVGAFLAGDGPLLQSELERYDADERNASWLDEFWRDRYLGRRDPIAVNANFFFRFRSEAGHDAGQLQRAAGLLRRAVDLRLRIDRDELPRSATPTSERQLRHLFCTMRIPGVERDTVRTQYTGGAGPSAARHVLVFFRGHLFALDVLDEAGVPYAEAALRTALARITAAVGSPAAHPVGALTTGPRAQWATDREALRATGNDAALEWVQTAMCGLALESEQPADAQAIDHALLAGSGRDRWFDLATTFVVFPDGTAGLNSEHCLLDGMTILTLIEDLAAPRRLPAAAEGAPAVRPVAFRLDDDLRARVDRALADFEVLGDRTALRRVPIDGLSRDAAKSLGCSPDAFFQIALQLAQVRARGGVGATYESIATRGWRNGRTEAMRVVTPQLVAFTRAMTEDADDARRIAAFDAAAEAHAARVRACRRGDAPEQHLWELDRIRVRRGAQLGIRDQPALFGSPGWQRMRDDALSTSAAVTEAVDSWGFGATGASCIGVAYALAPEHGFVCLSTPAPVAGPLSRLAAELQRAVTEITTLLRGRR